MESPCSDCKDKLFAKKENDLMAILDILKRNLEAYDNGERKPVPTIQKQKLYIQSLERVLTREYTRGSRGNEGVL